MTDESCTISCLPGYSIVGSATRTCLPDHTWDGEEASCTIMKCDELNGSEVMLVVQPCSREYLSVCSIICRDGYHVNASSSGWVQSCELSADGLTVQWTQPLTCSGKISVHSEVMVEELQAYKIKRFYASSFL